MRPYQQRQILETVQTLNEAVGEFAKQPDLNKASGLIAECMEFTHVIKNFIDDLTGKETHTGRLLTEYAALLEKYAGGEVTTDKLYKQIAKIESSVKTELKPDKIEVVFLSYNASMSDSLMSIYLSALADPDCDAYWIPIPYYRVESDGSLGELHFDAYGAYPGIECTDWREYDIEARHPEAIFTFNGYDEYNRVTRVHADFFCKRLKTLTDCLVYVPYFVVDSNAAPEIYEHFTNVPGTWYADQVILQDEKVRNTYIKGLTKAWGNRFGNPKEKFVALGSAKYDKAVNTRREDCDIPPKWRELIGDRKVVFYNTTIAGALRNPEHYLKKIMSVLQLFRERRDAVLWWRPHPLLLQTYASMLPGLYDIYKRIVEQYQREGWGIYDDTPDLHRAIAWSDVYYGDGSSVTELFKATGKAIYFQNIDPAGNRPIELIDDLYFHVTDIFKANDELYAVTYDEYIYKLSDKGFEYESKIPASPNLPRRRNYFTHVVTGDNLMYIPYNDNQIAVYNIKTREYDIYPLELRDEYIAPVNDESRNFFDGLIYNNMIFLIPSGYRNIVAFHLDTKETEHCLDLIKLFPKEKVKSLCYGWTWLNENTILLASLYTNEVLEFNLDTYAHKVHKLGRENQSFHSIFKYGEHFFLVGRQPFVLKWHYETGEVKIYDKLPGGFKVSKKQDWVFYMGNMRPYKNKLILPGGFTNMVLEFDLDACEFRKLDVFDQILNRKLKSESSNDLSFSTCNFITDNSFYFVHKHEVLYRYDFKTQAIEAVCDMAPVFTAEACKELNNSFVDSMLKGENSQVKIEENLPDGQSGKRIYNYIKSKVLKE